MSERIKLFVDCFSPVILSFILISAALLLGATASRSMISLSWAYMLARFWTSSYAWDIYLARRIWGEIKSKRRWFNQRELALIHHREFPDWIMPGQIALISAPIMIHGISKGYIGPGNFFHILGTGREFEFDPSTIPWALSIYTTAFFSLDWRWKRILSSTYSIAYLGAGMLGAYLIG